MHKIRKTKAKVEPLFSTLSKKSAGRVLGFIRNLRSDCYYDWKVTKREQEFLDSLYNLTAIAAGQPTLDQEEDE